MSRLAAGSILKDKKDIGIMAPGYTEENGSDGQSLFEGFQQSFDNENWDIATQLDLRFTVDSVKTTAKPESGLTYMQAAFFATVLEDFLKSIHIVGESQSKIRQIKANNDMDKLILKKYSIPDPPFPPDVLAGITNKNIGCEQFKLNKLIGDRLYMEKVITDTYKELSMDRSFLELVKMNAKFETQTQLFPNIVEEEAKNKSLRRKLRRQLRVQQNINATHMDTYCTRIHKLRDQIEETNLISNIEGQFLDRWQASRIEQQEEFIRRQEMSMTQKISKYKITQEEETRVHGEIDLLVGILINEMLAEIENLMLKYDKDTEALDIKIQKKRHAYEETVKERKKLEHILAEKRLHMSLWISYKEERQRRMEYEKKMYEAALVIQAWWRGLLARHDLGPFRHHKRRRTRRKKISNAL